MKKDAKKRRLHRMILFFASNFKFILNIFLKIQSPL